MDQRFYASGYGRFGSPDPYMASGGPSDPGSWNRYAYVGGDPINYADPGGLEKIGVWCGQVSSGLAGAVTTGSVQCSSVGTSVGTGAPVFRSDLSLPEQFDGTSARLANQREDDEKRMERLRQIEQCRKDVQNEVTAVRKSVADKIHEEFSPLPNVASLSLKGAIYDGYQGAKGTLIEEMGIEEIITTATGGAAFGGAVGAIMGATAAAITLPLNPYIEKLAVNLANSVLDFAQAVVKSRCDDSGRDLSAVPFAP